MIDNCPREGQTTGFVNPLAPLTLGGVSWVSRSGWQGNSSG